MYSRYRVELLVDDGNNYATFLVFNKEMLKLIKQDAATLLHDEVSVSYHTIVQTVTITDTYNLLHINETASVQVKYGEPATLVSASYTSTDEVEKVDAHTQGSERFKTTQT